MSKVLGVALALLALDASAGAAMIEDRIRSACRWIDSVEMSRINGPQGEVVPGQGVSAGCAVVLECLLEARSGSSGGGDDGSTGAAPADPASLCWRVADVERLSKEAIDRMLAHLDDSAKDDEAASCGRFLRCLSRSGIGATEDRSWHEEFARICSMTDVAGTLSREVLQGLVEDSETLLGVLERLSTREAKIYIFRLKKCRDLFAYSLQLLDGA